VRREEGEGGGEREEGGEADVDAEEDGGNEIFAPHQLEAEAEAEARRANRLQKEWKCSSAKKRHFHRCTFAVLQTLGGTRDADEYLAKDSTCLLPFPLRLPC